MIGEMITQQAAWRKSKSYRLSKEVTNMEQIASYCIVSEEGDTTLFDLNQRCRK